MDGFGGLLRDSISERSRDKLGEIIGTGIQSASAGKASMIQKLIIQFNPILVDYPVSRANMKDHLVMNSREQPILD